MPCRWRAVRLSFVLLFSVVLAVTVTAQTSEQAAAHAMGLEAQGLVAGPGDTIYTTRPVEALATLMERRYESPVTYEDPLWEFQGDFAPDGNGVQFPKFLTFVGPAELTQARRPKLDAEVLGEALAAYHSQTDGPRHRIATSRLGLHLIPDQVRGVDGAFAAAGNPLDTVVNMSITLRSASQHLEDLCAEVSTAMGARILVSAADANSFERVYAPDRHGAEGSTDRKVAWGAQGISAREALINLLDPSAATLHWRLICVGGWTCFFRVEPIKLPAPALEIGPSTHCVQPQIPELPLDWCVACPNRAREMFLLLAPLPVLVK